jgi:hypothetical protein
LDIYSGNPNPSWELSEDKAKEFTEMPGWMDIMNPEDHGLSLDLGYRGFIISVISEESEKIGSAKEGIEKTPYHPKLPNTFRIYGSKKSDESNKGFKPSLSIEDIQEKEKWLLDTMKTSPNLSKGFDQGLKTFNDNHNIKQLIEQAINDGGHPQQGISETLQESRQPSPEALASCNIWSAYYNPSFWNDPRYQGYNNCYNYAMNMRTNTFAQPGRAHGCNFSINCGSVSAAARCDGVVNSCGGSTPYYSVAMVVSTTWQDYHWYHWHYFSGFWGHKPGGTAARNYDNSGRVISPNQGLYPSNCNRGPYDIFCGYYYGLKDANIR